MTVKKRLAAMLLAAVMAVSAIPAGVSAEASGGEWTEDTFNSMLYRCGYLGETCWIPTIWNLVIHTPLCILTNGRPRLEP